MRCGDQYNNKVKNGYRPQLDNNSIFQVVFQAMRTNFIDYAKGLFYNDLEYANMYYYVQK